MSSPPSSSPKSPRRRRKHSRNRKSSSRTKMAVTEPASPSSPFSWRLERKTSSTKKSHGIAPARFHAKQEELVTNDEGSASPSKRQSAVPVWKEQIERNLLIQQQKAHTEVLEVKRRAFRRLTQLKTWPLQDMAMEHLDHLLGADANRQYHGGDYLSAESSSSLSSVETSKPRVTPQSAKSNQPDNEFPEELDKTRNDESKENSENGKSLRQKATQNRKTDGNSAPDEPNDASNEEQLQHSTPLWSLEPRIFATEKGNGKRKYLVGEFGRIADWYWRKTEPTSRHLYEVIREGHPCRLYFDLEFSRIHNPSIPEVRLLRELEEELTTELQLHYGKFLPRLKSSQIVNLDSSNDKKFSRHWVIHLPCDLTCDDEQASAQNKQPQEFLFKDAPTVGRFVKRMVGRLADDMAAEGGDFAQRRPTLAKHLFVNTKDPTKQTCFIDLGVYTRNRLFRCLGSSKKGKTTTLQVVFHEREAIEPQQIADKDDNAPSEVGADRYYFPLSIPQKKEIESSQSSSNMLSMDSFIVANDWEPYAQALADSLVVPLKNKPLPSDSTLTSIETETDNTVTRILEVEEGSPGPVSITNFTDNSRNTSQTKYRPSTPMARQGSPLPSLDQYVMENLATRGGVRGSIRAWSVEYGHRDTPVSFTYHMQRNRFCEIVGRSHKSNNIFWTIDVNSWTCIQGCHDPDCFGRGCPISINNASSRQDDETQWVQGNLDKIKQEFETWQEEEFEKALMELNLDDIVAPPDDKKPPSNSQTNHDRRGKDEEKSDESGDLSDDALLQAIVDNPEMFP